jgi:hypothetical protein
MQVPLQTMSQQTPCWQVPEAHSLATWQDAPMTFFPQIVPLQTLPAAQSVLLRQLTRQVPVAPHAYSLQVSAPPETQVPAPSHFQAAVPTDPPTGQVGSLQTVAFE